MDSGEELPGAGASHAWSLPTAHASRSFSAGGATSACLTPPMLFSLAAPLVFTSESCFSVPPATGVSHHPWRMPCSPAASPPPHLRHAAPLLGTLTFHLSALCPRLNTANTHPPCGLTPLEGDSRLRTGSLTHLRVTMLPEHSPSPPPGEESGRPHCLGAWPSPALCWVRVTRRPRPPQTQGSRGTSWHPRS